MTYPPLELLEVMAHELQNLAREVVFVGGVIVPVLITDPTAPPSSSTKDVDVIVSVTTHFEYTQGIGNRLRDLGFSEDSEPGAPMCRWCRHGMKLDVMPTDPKILQFSNRWFPLAFDSAVSVQLPSGCIIKIATGPCFLGTKLEAFLSRGQGDYLGSKDMEDFLAVLHGRKEIIEEVARAPRELISYLAEMAKRMSRDDDVDASIEAHLPGEDPEIVRLRVREIIAIDNQA